jgi:hypothetical protein
MTTSFKQKCISIILGVGIAVLASYVSALSRPSSIYTNPNEILNVGTSSGLLNSQVKNGQINVPGLMVGTYSGTYTTINSQGYINTCSLSAYLGALTVCGTNIDNTAPNGFVHSIRSTALAWTAGGSTISKPLCADSSGKIILCSVNDFNSYSGSGAGSSTRYDTFVVPSGVTSINVTVIGGGGAGYGSKNTDGTGFDDGDDSYLIGTGATIIAKGGKGASNISGYAQGGTATATGSGVNSGSTVTTGGTGAPGVPGTQPSPYSTTPISCGGTDFLPIAGGVGPNGGYGGSTGSSGQASGGIGGIRGPLTNQEYNGNITWTFLTSAACTILQNKTSDEVPASWMSNAVRYNRKGGDGTDGYRGGGGSGFGGRGGASAFVQSTKTCDNIATDQDFTCESGISGAGGGAGGYAQATISVTAGQVFYLKIGGGGNPQTNSCTGTNCVLKQPGGGAVSGRGGDGYISISY